MAARGAVAERLGRGLQSLVQRFESARRLSGMSMTMSLAALSDEELDGLSADPSKAVELIFEAEDFDAGDGDELAYLDKAWQGIHYLLTGTAWGGEPPWNTLLAGGTELPGAGEEWGYGPPRC